MAELPFDINKFIDHGWREIDNNSLVCAFHSEELKLADVPTLIVGIGGTGVEAARTVKEKIEQHYHPHVAKKLEYLFIDTDEASVAGLKGSDTLIVQSADTAILLREYKEKGTRSNITLAPEITEWLDPEISPFRVMNGAAGIRQAGRLILFLNINRVYHMLQQKLDKISVGYDQQRTRIKVHIFTGIGGGTGSGMFIDISYLIRHIRPNCELQGFVFMPDVSCMKRGLHDVHRRNIKRNAFAALREIEQLMTMEMYDESFEQSYPGNIAHISTRYPIFEFCVLIGSMQDGRQRLGSEQEVFEHAAEYLLLELHQKEQGAFDFESFKSNLCAESNKDYYFTKYVSIDADARYLPLNHYYSWWLSDIFQLICNGLEAIPFTIKNDSIVKEIIDDRNGFWRTQRNSIRWCSLRGRYAAVTSTIRHELRATIQNNLGLPGSLAAKLNLLGEHAVDVWRELPDQFTKYPDKGDKWFAGPLFSIKWQRFARCYRTVCLSDDGYKSAIYDIVVHAESFIQLMRAIYGKCRKYMNTAIHASDFAFAEQVFQMLQSQENYQKSVESAATKIVDDFLKDPDLWFGKKDLGYDGLSGHVAALIATDFERSGCTSIRELLGYFSQAGVPFIQEQFNELLDELHTAQLWPIKSGIISSTLPNYNAVKILAHSNESTIQNWVKTWSETTKDKISNSSNKMHDRIAMGVYASGYALRCYEGVDEWEREYETATNRAGLRLYAGDRADWNRPFSPLFSFDWEESDNSRDQVEAREYLKVFNDAMKKIPKDGSKTLIYYDESERKYVYQLSAQADAKPIGTVEGDESEEYRRFVFELFIRMRKLRDSVKKALEDLV